MWSYQKHVGALTWGIEEEFARDSLVSARLSVAEQGESHRKGTSFEQVLCEFVHDHEALSSLLHFSCIGDLRGARGELAGDSGEIRSLVGGLAPKRHCFA